MARQSAYTIFSTVKFPIYTYVRRTIYEDQVIRCLKRGQIAFIHGMSRIGKTVLAKSILNHPDDVIASENFQSSSEFWEKIARQLNIAETENVIIETSIEQKKAVNYFAKVAAFFAEAGTQAELGHGETKTKSKSVTKQIDVPHKIAGLRRPLIIDNFHFIKRNVQIDVLKAIKGIIESEKSFPVIIIATTDNPSYLSDILSDLGMQYTPITILPWSPDELAKIPLMGFPLLYTKLTPLLIETLVQETRRSPVIMQAMCLELALQKGLEHPPSNPLPDITIDDIHLPDIYRRVTETSNRMGDYSRLIRYAIASSSVRGSIALLSHRNITYNKAVSYHEALLQAIISERGLAVSFGELEKAFHRITIPNTATTSLVPIDTVLAELHQASLKLFDEKISLKPSSDTVDVPLIEWDMGLDRISVPDPKFAFFLRWSGQLSDILE